MKVAFGTLALALIGFSVSGLVQAQDRNQDQAGAVDQLVQFIGSAGPSLYEGHDQVGHCRVLIYPAGNSERSSIWLEGTFRTPSGAAAGIAVPFVLSTSSDESRLQKINVNGLSFMADVIVPSQQGDIRIVLYIEKRDDGSIKSIGYDIPIGNRTCDGLKKTL